MTDKKNHEPRDEFDVVKLPGFIATPIARLANQTPIRYPDTPASQPSDQTPDPYADDASSAGDYPPADEQQRPARGGLFSGTRGKLIIYGVGTVLMIALQFRG